MVNGKCVETWCKGHELTWWDQMEVIFWFFGPVAIILFIMIILIVWLSKK